MTALRVAIVGCGRIADQHMAAIKRIPFADVVGVCDREELMAEQLAERNSVSYVSGDVATLLQTVRPDVVHITTPPQSHFPLANQCLEAGCHVYVEKPFTLDTKEAERLVQTAIARNLKLTAGHNLQLTWENQQARRLVDSGFLGGPPVFIESYYTYDLSDARYAASLLGDRNHWVRRLPGKLLHNVISHGIARIAEFMQTPKPQVSAFGYTSPHLLAVGAADVVDELRVHLSDGANMTAMFVFSSQLKPPLNGYRLYGPRHSLAVDNVRHTMIRSEHRNYKSYVNYFLTPVRVAQEHLRASAQNVGRFLRADFHDDSGLKNLVEAFYLAVAGEAPLPMSYDEILRTSTIMDDIFFQLSNIATRREGDDALPRLAGTR